jgi:DNA-directed RNA polymerase specialized sigma24 family protein
MTPTTDADLWQIATKLLTPKELEAVQLRYRDELPITAIATHLGISRQAVNERITRGLRRIANTTLTEETYPHA